MNRNFEIVDGGAETRIKLADLGMKLDTPKTLSIEFNEVREFLFMPRDSETPFTGDDCINSFRYWVDEN